MQRLQSTALSSRALKGLSFCGTIAAARSLSWHPCCCCIRPLRPLLLHHTKLAVTHYAISACPYAIVVCCCFGGSLYKRSLCWAHLSFAGRGKEEEEKGEEEGERGGRRRDSTDSYVNPSKAVTIALLEGRRKGKKGPFMYPEWDKMMM